MKVVTFQFNPVTAGTSWTVPTGVTRLRAYAIGGGGGGAGLWGGGSGGEAIAIMQVTSGTVVSIRVGGGGTYSMSGPIPAGQSQVYAAGMMIQGYGGEIATVTEVGQGGASNTSGGPGMSNTVTKNGNSGNGQSGGGGVDSQYPLAGSGGSGALSGTPGLVIITY